MSYSDIILLAIALSIDACVVSFAYGLCIEDKNKRSAFALALTTGFFQAFMPVIGYYFTDIVRTLIQPYAKWIVFLIFIYLGVNFIKEALEKSERKNLCITPKSLLLIGIATSIDAFSAGISLSLTSSPMKFSIISIGLITFINSLLGYFAGHRLKSFKADYLQILGGVILIFLAVKNLF